MYDEYQQATLAALYQQLRAIPYYPHYRGPDRTEYMLFPRTSDVLPSTRDRLRLVRDEDGRVDLQVSSYTRIQYIDDLMALSWDDLVAAMVKAIESIPKFDEKITVWRGSLLSLQRWRRYLRKQARRWGGRPANSGSGDGGWFRQHVFGMPIDMATYADEQDRKDRSLRQRATYLHAHKNRKPKRGFPHHRPH